MKLTAVPDYTKSTVPTHDHVSCRNKAIHTAEQLCTVRGVRLTPTRRRVLELIWESHRAVKAYDLLDRIRPFEQTAKPATVYRALDFLLAQGRIYEEKKKDDKDQCSFLYHLV